MALLYRQRYIVVSNIPKWSVPMKTEASDTRIVSDNP